MSDDLERRLRDSLRAYADLVRPPDDDALPSPAAEARPRRWRVAVLAAAAAAAVVVGALVVVDVHDPGTGPAAGVAAGSLTGGQGGTPAPRTAQGSASDQAMSAPAGGSALADAAQPGTTFRVDLYTHCGVRGIDIGGVWFAAEPPLVEQFGPPPGWGDPDQPGTVTRLTATEAVFRDDRGHEVALRADEAARPGPCG